MGKELEFTFNYQANTRMYNTFFAHQLLHWAGKVSGKQAKVYLRQ